MGLCLHLLVIILQRGSYSPDRFSGPQQLCPDEFLKFRREEVAAILSTVAEFTRREMPQPRGWPKGERRMHRTALGGRRNEAERHLALGRRLRYESDRQLALRIYV